MTADEPPTHDKNESDAFADPENPTPAAAQALVDQALRYLGVDPAAAADEHGWRRISLKTIQGKVGIIESAPYTYALVVWAPVLPLPVDLRLRYLLFETLLQLNHHETGGARFARQGDTVILTVVRPIRGLGLEEVLDAIIGVLEFAAEIETPLRRAFAVALPGIPLEQAMWQALYDFFIQCEVQPQQVFKRLLETWAAHQGRIVSGNHTVALVGPASGKRLAALIARASAGPLITLGWDSWLQQGLPPETLAQFKQATPRPAHFSETASSAHLPVTAGFPEALVAPLVQALLTLDQALQHAIPPQPKPLPDLAARWGVTLQAGAATLRNVDTVLTASPAAARQVFVQLLQGWNAAEQAVYTNNPRLIYLRLTVDEHTFALATLRAPQPQRDAHIELTYPLHYYFEARPEARQRYELAVAQLPGFTVDKTRARILLTESWGAAETVRLLQILITLAGASRT